MTEQPDVGPAAHEDDVPESSGAQAHAAATGDPGVDTVVSTLDRLDQLSVQEHLPLFEEAHEALRRALNRPAEASGSGG